MIPSDRIDPAARNIMDFFYPLPNQGVLANGYGVFQQFVPQTRNRQRGDIRIDHRATQNDTFFFRGRISAPGSEQHPVRGGQRLHELADPRTRTSTRRRRSAGGPRSSSPTDGQRVPGRLQLRQLEAGKHFPRGRRLRPARHRERARVWRRPARVPELPRSRRARTGRPTSPIAGRNVDRTLRQNAFSISDNFTWITGGHS